MGNSIETKPMSMIGEQACATQDGDQRSEPGPAGDQEHDQQLIFDRIDRLDARKNLAGHHPRQGNEADRRHAVHDRHEAASQGVADNGQKGLVSGAAERKTGFHRGSFAHQAVGQNV